MRVLFKRNWFGPNGHLYQIVNGAAVEVPDQLLNFLPVDAVVLDGSKNPNSLKDQSAAVKAFDKLATERAGTVATVYDSGLAPTRTVPFSDAAAVKATLDANEAARTELNDPAAAQKAADEAAALTKKVEDDAAAKAKQTAADQKAADEAAAADAAKKADALKLQK